MKLKSLLVISASIAMTSTAFAVVWEKPVPQTTQLTTVKNVNDGKVMYLYNSDYKGFYHGANEYGTRASVGNTGLPIKFVEQASGKYAIYHTQVLMPLTVSGSTVSATTITVGLSHQQPTTTSSLLFLPL